MRSHLSGSEELRSVVARTLEAVSDRFRLDGRPDDAAALSLALVTAPASP